MVKYRSKQGNGGSSLAKPQKHGWENKHKKKFEEALKNMSEQLSEFQDCPKEFSDVINESFWDIVGDPKEPNEESSRESLYLKISANELMQTKKNIKAASNIIDESNYWYAELQQNIRWIHEVAMNLRRIADGIDIEKRLREESDDE